MRFLGAARRLGRTVAVVALAVSRSPTVLVVIGLIALALMTVLIVVMCPAVWSKKKQRRDAALNVLRILRGRPDLGP